MKSEELQMQHIYVVHHCEPFLGKGGGLKSNKINKQILQKPLINEIDRWGYRHCWHPPQYRAYGLQNRFPPTFLK